MGLRERFGDFFNKKGQVTIFVIIAILVVAATVIFFIFRSNFIAPSIPADIQPIYNTLTSCIQDYATTGINILESQAGYITLPDFSPGSSYMPFSNELDFLGNPVPYWHYYSGNNLEKEQVPKISDMENQLADYIDGKIRNCIFDYGNDTQIILGEPKSTVSINPNSVDVSLKMNFNVKKGDENFLSSTQKVSVNSEIGSLYDSAKKIYDYEQQNMFLENYTVDALRFYAPVDGVEIQCSPAIWNANDVFNNISQAIVANTLAINTIPGDYFTKKLPVNNARFLTSANWSRSFDVSPSQGPIMTAQALGNQQGLGVLGFCYVPYHFVYNIKYPVLVQLYGDDNEIFQFPLAIVIEGNKPRQASPGTTTQYQIPDLCAQSNIQTSVNVYNTNLQPVDADISYECSSSVCNIGKTSSGTLTANFPQCVNGFVIANADGYEQGKTQFSVIDGGQANVVLDKIYPLHVELKLDGSDYNGQATVSFTSNDTSRVISYPNQKQINLSEGQYEVRTYIYRNSSIDVGAIDSTQCIDVPQSGFAGVLGFTKQNCYNIQIPKQIVSNALAGGGVQNYYVVESQLQNSNTLEIDASSLPTPTSIDDLQNNYQLFENQGLGVIFK